MASDGSTALRRGGLVSAVALGAGVVALSTIAAPPGVLSGGGPMEPQPWMGDPLPELDADQQTRFETGREAFLRPISLEEGLGPVFNRPTCGVCHIHPIRGGSGSLTVTRFGYEEEGAFDPLAEYGGTLLQMLSISEDCAEEIPPEANVVIERVVNGAFGYGLVEAIPDADLLALEQDPPGISGRAHMVEALEEPGVPRVGRFGWKAQIATILSFSADASRNEMGFTNRLVVEDADPNGTRAPHLEDCDAVEDPEDGPDGEGFHFIDRVTDFQRFLAKPPQTPRSGTTGEGIFMSIGCGDCHHPAFTTADDPELEPALRNKAIRPYADFLLHDMGRAGDGIVQGDADRYELRTPPLWGLRVRDRLWHDGRFADADAELRVTRAIEAHEAEGSEAADVTAAWFGLSPEEQDAVRRFLDTLGRREFDADGNSLIVLDDFVAFVACYTGPGEYYVADDDCAISDIDQDGDVDDDDYASFFLVYTGPLDDCNENGELDLDDILYGASEDNNSNGVPDECEPCRADFDQDGQIGFSDIIALLSEWGSCSGQECPHDLDGSGSVDFGDILELLTMWGPCE